MGIREEIRAEVAGITPGDALEKEQLAAALAWIDSGVEIFRVAKPATPPQHLVSYCLLVDGEHVLLVDHKNAMLWLPSGGHVDVGEHPRSTAIREMKEELGIEAQFAQEHPAMLTITETVGHTAGHWDVSFWYVLRGDRHAALEYDAGEFNGIRWFHYSEVPLNRADPHMGRFIAKMFG